MSLPANYFPYPDELRQQIDKALSKAGSVEKLSKLWGFRSKQHLHLMIRGQQKWAAWVLKSLGWERQTITTTIYRRIEK